MSIAWLLAADPATAELLVATAGPLDDVDGDPGTGPLGFIAAASPQESQKITKFGKNCDPLNLKNPSGYLFGILKISKRQGAAD